MMEKQSNVHVEPRKCDGAAVQFVSVTGFLDAHTCPQLENCLSDLLSSGERRFVIDLSGLDYISSAGLGVVLGAKRVAARDGGDLKIIHMSKSIYGVFSTLGFARLIEVHDDWEAAARAFSARDKQKGTGDQGSAS